MFCFQEGTFGRVFQKIGAIVHTTELYCLEVNNKEQNLILFQITRSHYQNAVTATRMDSSPQTPDADTRLSEGNTLTPEPPTTAHSATLMPPQHTTASTLMPPPRELGRPGSARTRGQQSSVPHSTSLLNEKNRIVRESPPLFIPPHIFTSDSCQYETIGDIRQSCSENEFPRIH